MKYSEMKYVRPDIVQTVNVMSALIREFANADSFESADNHLIKINDIRNEFDSMKIIAFINYSLNTGDEKFSQEQDYFDNITPVFTEYVVEYYKELVHSKFKVELIEKYGRQLFLSAEVFLKSFNASLIEDMQEENHLGSEYVKLKASAEIPYEGKIYNLQELEPFLESHDRNIRRNASGMYWNFFTENQKQFDEIFDKLVKLRNEMSFRMGYKDFVEIGYARMRRIDYDEKMVSEFRDSIKEFFVPVATKLRDKQRKRLGLDKLTYYDSFVQFNSGNATPKGNPEWIMQNGKIMYDSISDVTAEFYDFMMKNNLMDVYSRHGKADMGYCEHIAKYKSPFIFANMNGTEDDITVLTHEAGHALQAYLSRDFIFKEYVEPSYETAEIHSMSMEFFTYPWMNLFFNEDTDKFKFSHLSSAINFLPYGVLVDHFQHWVYRNPEVSAQERNREWRKLEKEYMPHIDYMGNKFLEEGGRWQKQSHIYEAPFYYIDYCLAQIIALQFWSKAIHAGNEQYGSCLSDYFILCCKGGSQPFLELLREANLESPFEKGVIQKISEEVDNYIESIDDLKF